MTKLSWEKFEPLFETWANKISPFFNSGGFDEIYETLKADSKAGKEIAPISSLVYKALELTPYENLTCVMVGLSPYHTKKAGKQIADGILMSAAEFKGDYIPPSLEQFYGALEVEFSDGMCLQCINNGDLTHLTTQGVLMWNFALTTHIEVAGNHVSLWEPFQKFFFEEIISLTGVPVITLGKEAKRVNNYLSKDYPIFNLIHPASASYSGGVWDSKGVFKQVKDLIKATNNINLEWLDNLPF